MKQFKEWLVEDYRDDAKRKRISHDIAKGLTKGQVIDYYDQESGDKVEMKVGSANERTVSMKPRIDGKWGKTQKFDVAAK